MKICNRKNDEKLASANKKEGKIVMYSFVFFQHLLLTLINHLLQQQTTRELHRARTIQNSGSQISPYRFPHWDLDPEWKEYEGLRAASGGWMSKAQKVRGHLIGILKILCKWKLLFKQLQGSSSELTLLELKFINLKDYHRWCTDLMFTNGAILMTGRVFCVLAY